MKKSIIKSNLLQHHKICDFLYHEGPMLSLYRDAEGRLFFYKWCDVDQNLNKWLVAYITPEELRQFFNREKTLLHCILSSEIALMIYIDKEIEIQREVKVIKVNKEMRKDELPSEDSYFDKNIYTEDSTIISSFFIDTMRIKDSTKATNPFLEFTEGQTITDSIIYLS